MSTYQLTIRNFNHIIRIHVNGPCVFYFYVVFLKIQNISSTYLQRKNTSSCLKTTSSCLKHVFLLYSSLKKKTGESTTLKNFGERQLKE